jgi:hypothetical protein
MNAVSRRAHEVNAPVAGDHVSRPDWIIRIVAVPPGEAPLWVREDTPHLIAPKRYIVFHEEVCRIADI